MDEREREAITFNIVALYCRNSMLQSNHHELFFPCTLLINFHQFIINMCKKWNSVKKLELKKINWVMLLRFRFQYAFFCISARTYDLA